MTVVGYYDELTVVRVQILCQLSSKENLVNHYISFSHDQMIINAHGIECLIIFKFHFDCIEALFFNKKINRSRLYLIKKEKQQEGFVQV